MATKAVGDVGKGDLSTVPGKANCCSHHGNWCGASARTRSTI